MPIRPKHTLDAATPAASRQFTDRVEFIADFRSLLDSATRTEPTVLVFYGVGGIGKTALRLELARMLDAGGTATAHTTLDFDVPAYRDPESALLTLRRDLQRKYGISFFTFDLASAAHWQLTRPQTAMTPDRFPLLTESAVLAELAAHRTEGGRPDLLAGLARLSSSSRPDVRDWWLSRGARELQGLAGLDPVQVGERLPMFWAADLRGDLASRNRKAVVFIDTYEALAQGERSEAKMHQRDEWVRELVAQLPEVVWVVCGRERLRWGEIDPDWDTCLRQRLLGGLADPDACSYLSSCGITDTAIQDEIVAASEGVPHYLELAVDTYGEIRAHHAREPEPGDFARTRRDMLARFLSHLTQPEIETLKVLSAARHWDHTLFELLVTKYQTGYPVTAFQELCRFSFMDEGAVPGTWRMNQLMREALQEHQPPEARRTVHQFLFDHYAGQLAAVTPRNLGADHKAAFVEAYHQARQVLDPTGISEWLLRNDETFAKSASWSVLVPLYEDCLALLEDRVGPEHAETAAVVERLARAFQEQGRYQVAEPLFRRLLATREKALGGEHLDVAQALSELGKLRFARGDYQEAESCYKRAMTIKEKTLGPSHPEIARLLYDIALLLGRRGRNDEGIAVVERALAIREQTLPPDHPEIADSYNTLGFAYWAQGRLPEAEPCFEKATTIREKTLGPDHPDVAQSLNNLAVLYARVGRYAHAEKAYRRALEIREKALGESHPETAYSQFWLASLYRDLGRLDEAERLCLKALAAREGILGPDHPSTAQSVYGLAELRESQGRFEDAEKLFRRSLEIREQKLGKDNFATAQSVTGLAKLLHDMGRHPEAEQLFRRALAIREAKQGTEHPDLVKCIVGLAATRAGQGDAIEAEQLLRRAVMIGQRQLGARNPVLAEALHRLGGICAARGDLAEAEVNLRRSVAGWEKALGPGTRRLIGPLHDLAELLARTGRPDEAATNLARIESIKASSPR
jgi:tetratricopeptide (TPR) repeat protein